MIIKYLKHLQCLNEYTFWREGTFVDETSPAVAMNYSTVVIRSIRYGLKMSDKAWKTLFAVSYFTQQDGTQLVVISCWSRCLWNWNILNIRFGTTYLYLEGDLLGQRIRITIKHAGENGLPSCYIYVLWCCFCWQHYHKKITNWYPYIY